MSCRAEKIKGETAAESCTEGSDAFMVEGYTSFIICLTFKV